MSGIGIVTVVLIILYRFSRDVTRTSVMTGDTKLIFLVGFTVFFVFDFSLFTTSFFFGGARTVLHSTVVQGACRGD